MKQVFLDNNEIKIIYDENDNIIFKRKPKNLIPLSIDTDGSIYNNGLGYIQGYRLNSSGGISESPTSFATGFIPYKQKEKDIYFYNASIAAGDLSYISFYDSNFSVLGSVSTIFQEGKDEIFYTCRGICKDTSITTCSFEEGARLLIDFTDRTQVAYFRINGYCSYPSAAILTKNEIIDYKSINKIFSSTEANSTSIYNNGLGYKRGYRVRSAGAEVESYSVISGYIKVKDGDVLRLVSENPLKIGSDNAINAYDSSYACIGQTTCGNGNYGIFLNADTPGWSSFIEETPGIFKYTIPAGKNISYIRLTSYNKNSKVLLLTINEEII